MTSHALAYLHGFASSAGSRKGTWLASQLAERGHTLHLPDLNRPSFAELTITGALAAMDALDEEHGTEGGWCLIGSSMGGFVTARWAELHPDRVHRLLLLCPGFGLPARWPSIIGEEAFARWEATGRHAFPDAVGELVEVHWGFIEDARSHPATPVVPCPTRIVHGRADETVPFGGSEAYAERHDHVELIAVDDDHRLTDSVERILAEAIDLFELGRR